MPEGAQIKICVVRFQSLPDWRCDAFDGVMRDQQ